MASTIPGWALSTAGLREDRVLAWVAGKQSSEWFPPVFMLTDTEIVWVDRGFFSKTVHRVPRSSVRSIAYTQGLMTDRIIINVAGGDLADSGIKLSKDHRERGKQIVGLLQKQLAS